MKAQLLHLSGPQRGATLTYPDRVLTLGSGPRVTVPFRSGAVAPLHAQIEFSEPECNFHLSALNGQVFVNGREVREIILEEDDLIELGPNGPKLRFRIHYEPGAVCKPVRQMLSDAVEVHGECGLRTALWGFWKDVVRHSSWSVKIVTALMIGAVAFASAYLGGALGSRRMQRYRMEQSAAITEQLAAMRRELRRQLDDFLHQQGGRATTSELEALRQDLARRAIVVDSMVAHNVALRRVLDEFSHGVCLLYGVYAFAVPGQTEMAPTLGPDGNRLEIEYLGSGFLASRDGWILTNRHVAQPWWNNDAASGLMEQGALPLLVQLMAYFPGHPPMSVDLTTIRISNDGVDVAAARLTSQGTESLPVLPLFAGDVRDLRGSHVILLGYPTGLNGVLARAEQNVATDILRSVNDTRGLLDKLADQSLIAPIITQGALNEVRERRLVYDAETTSGGSGGPVFGPDGTVIGINFAITRDFAGSNFGIPIAFAKTLLTQVQEELTSSPPTTPNG